jgi:7-cyano-7-deazaguanine synthase
VSIAPETVVLLSGGIDSAACLRFVCDIGRPASALFVNYGQPAARQEAIAAKEISNHYGVQLIERTLTCACPKSHGLITGRNAFLLFTALMERPQSATAVAIGVHSGTDYVDCSVAFVRQMNSLFHLYTAGHAAVVAPFVEWTKPEVWHYSITHDVPLNLTYSCEKGGDQPCGNCLSCRDREALHAHS